MQSPSLPCPEGALRVKPGLNSLKNALAEAEEKCITEIFLENGVHTIEEYGVNDGYDILERNYVNINLSISIIGECREHCIVIGGLRMTGKKKDDVNVSNLTLRDSKGNGVWGDCGASIHLDNVSVENSGDIGVAVYRERGSATLYTLRNSMKNCNVSHSKRSGVCSNSLIISGNATTIQHNGNYGLESRDGADGCIHLVAPLNIATICKNNGRGQYGGKGTLESVDKKGKVLQVIHKFEDQSWEWYNTH